MDRWQGDEEVMHEMHVMHEMCPLCRTRIRGIARLRSHLVERHGVDPLRTVPRSAKLLEAVPAYEWGKPFFEISRSRIPIEEAEIAEPHHGEIRQFAVDEQGNAVNITPQGAVAEEIRRNLVGQGVSPKYIWISGPSMRTQYTASPLPIWAVIVIIAAAIIAVIGVVYFAGREVYKLVVAPLPDFLEPLVVVALIGGTGYLAYKAASAISR